MSTTKTDVSRYIVNVQGKDFITFPGLLAEAHAQGLVDIKTDLLNQDMKSPIMRATVTLNVDGKIKTFTGFGDANENNVAKKVAGALIRMCETRAIARALRFACNIDMAALEELDSDDNVISTPKAAPVAAKGFTKPTITVTSPGNKVETKQVDETTTEVQVSGPVPIPVKEEVKQAEAPKKADPFKFGRRTPTKSEPNFP